MCDGKKQDQKDKQTSPILSKMRENVFATSTNKQPTGEKLPTSSKERNVQAESNIAQGVAQDDGPFEDVDLSDPPREDPDFEFVDHRDAPHSSYNTQKDHKWKYDKDFGKDKGGGNGKEKK